MTKPFRAEEFSCILFDFDEVDSQELAVSIVDWRDNDSKLSIPLGSAEDSGYRGVVYSYEAKDAEFEILEEVLLVLGLNESLVEKILGFRYGKKESDLSKGNFFDVSSNIVPRLSQYTDLSDSRIAFLNLISEQYLCTNSNNFMIRSVAGLDNRKNTVELNCVVNRGGKILYSQEN